MSPSVIFSPSPSSSSVTTDDNCIIISSMMTASSNLSRLSFASSASTSTTTDSPSSSTNDRNNGQQPTFNLSPISSNIAHNQISSPHVHMQDKGGTMYFYDKGGQSEPLNTSSRVGGGRYGETEDGPSNSNKVIGPAWQQNGPAQPTYYGPPSHVAHYRPHGPSYFTSDSIRETLMNQNEMWRKFNHGTSSSDGRMATIPDTVDHFHSITPLESNMGAADVSGGPQGFFQSHPSTTYRGVDSKDGQVYALRRLHNCRLLNAKCFLSMIEQWKKLDHPHVVHLRQVFTTKAFNDFSLVFVYDYHGGAETLKARHFPPSISPSWSSPSTPVQYPSSPHLSSPPSLINNRSLPAELSCNPRVSAENGLNGLPCSTLGSATTNQSNWNNSQQQLTESQIWFYIVQLAGALRCIHAAGLAATTIDPTKIIICGQSKLMINCCGIMDVLIFEQQQANQGNMNISPAHFQVGYLQQDDLISLGRLIVALCCGNLQAAGPENLSNSVGFIAQNFSPDMKNIVTYLFAQPPMQGGRLKNINDVMPMIGARFFSQLEVGQNRIDILENELAKELDNGRLFRLICKLGTINERPEYDSDAGWAETGDRYIIKLFRDYLFHQVTADGKPWLDMAHIVQTLNKVDAGSNDEKLMLSSRDEQSVLLVSYADLRDCMERSFNELYLLTARSRTGSSMNSPLDHRPRLHHHHHPSLRFHRLPLPPPPPPRSPSNPLDLFNP